jgi:hypothetical protein
MSDDTLVRAGGGVYVGDTRQPEALLQARETQELALLGRLQYDMILLKEAIRNASYSASHISRATA